MYALYIRVQTCRSNNKVITPLLLVLLLLSFIGSVDNAIAYHNNIVDNHIYKDIENVSFDSNLPSRSIEQYYLILDFTGFTNINRLNSPSIRPVNTEISALIKININATLNTDFERINQTIELHEGRYTYLEFYITSQDRYEFQIVSDHLISVILVDRAGLTEFEREFNNVIMNQSPISEEAIIATVFIIIIILITVTTIITRFVDRSKK
jgi:hypothetical protein